MKKKVLIGIVAVIIVCVSAVVIKEMNKSDVADETVINNSSKEKKDGNAESEIKSELTGCSEAMKNAGSDFESVKNGEYSNMDFSKCIIDIPDVRSVYELKSSADYLQNNMTDKELAESVEKMVDRFYEGEFKNIEKLPGRATSDNGESTDITFEGFKAGKYEGKFNPLLTIFFRDDRETGGKGFCQIDPGMRQVWMSRGDLEDTAPMSSYQTVKVYQVYEGNKELEDSIDMKNGSMKVSDGVKFVEDYFNSKLYDRKNEDTPFCVSSVEILDTGKFLSMGFRVGKSYKGVKFETAPSIESSNADDNYADMKGEVVMARNDRIENFSGLGAAHDPVEEVKEYNEIVPLKEAIKLVSESLGENSEYDIRSINVRYQFVYSKKIDDPDYNSWDTTGTPVWKISAINKQDKTGKIFYVNMGNGEVRYRRASAVMIAAD